MHQTKILQGGGWGTGSDLPLLFIWIEIRLFVKEIDKKTRFLSMNSEEYSPLLLGVSGKPFWREGYSKIKKPIGNLFKCIALPFKDYDKMSEGSPLDPAFPPSFYELILLINTSGVNWWSDNFHCKWVCVLGYFCEKIEKTRELSILDLKKYFSLPPGFDCKILLSVRPFGFVCKTLLVGFLNPLALSVKYFHFDWKIQLSVRPLGFVCKALWLCL